MRVDGIEYSSGMLIHTLWAGGGGLIILIVVLLVISRLLRDGRGLTIHSSRPARWQVKQAEYEQAQREAQRVAADNEARTAGLKRIEAVRHDIETREADINEVIAHNALFHSSFEPTRAFEEFDFKLRDMDLDAVAGSKVLELAAELELLHRHAVDHAVELGYDALSNPGLGKRATKLASMAADHGASEGERLGARTKLESVLDELGIIPEARQLDALVVRELEMQ